MGLTNACIDGGDLILPWGGGCLPHETIETWLVEFWGIQIHQKCWVIVL